MAHNATEIDIKTSNELAVRALQNLQHETEINTSSLIQAIENTEDDSIKKLAEDIFVGSPSNHKRILNFIIKSFRALATLNTNTFITAIAAEKKKRNEARKQANSFRFLTQSVRRNWLSMTL